jgi:hypothetical protein
MNSKHRPCEKKRNFLNATNFAEAFQAEVPHIIQIDVVKSREIVESVHLCLPIAGGRNRWGRVLCHSG